MIHGGAAKGNLADNDGGNLECHGGPAAAGPGGAILLQTGYSMASSSGDMTLQTANAGEAGVSGGIRAHRHGL